MTKLLNNDQAHARIIMGHMLHHAGTPFSKCTRGVCGKLRSEYDQYNVEYCSTCGETNHTQH